MDYQDCRAILHWARVLAVAAKLLGKIRFVSVAAGFEAQEKHARFLLAYRSRERHSFAAKHRSECALVFHCSSRTRSRLLLQSLYAAGGSVFVAARSGARISRRRRRIDRARFQPGALS